MKIETLFGVMFIMSSCTPLLVLWNRRRVARKYKLERFATGGFVATTPYRISEDVREETMRLDYARLSLPMSPVVKPTIVTIKSYTSEDMVRAFEQGRLKERAALVSMLSSRIHR